MTPVQRVTITILAAAALLSACANGPSRIAAVDQLYMQRLSGRLALYNKSAAELDADLKQQQSEAAPAPVAVAAADAKPDGGAAFADKVFRVAELRARAAILDRFMREAASSGQFGFMSSWLDQNAAELIRYSKQTDGAAAQFQRDAAADPSNRQLVDRFITLVVQRGTEQGAAEELFALSNDLQGYRKDYAGAAAVDEKRREDNVKLLSAYLSAPRVMVQPPAFAPGFAVPPPMPRFTTCMPNVFGSVNCATQ
jgi:hypothetical protein